MNENTRAMIRVEYERERVRKVCYGELDEIKLEKFIVGEENFMWLRNNAEITWIDKNSILRIDVLEVNETLLENIPIEF